MSHFTAVIITKDSSQEALDRLLAPYDENTKVEPYAQACECSEFNLRNHAWYNNPKLNGDAIEAARVQLYKQHAKLQERINAIQGQAAISKADGAKLEKLEEQLQTAWRKLLDPIEAKRKALEDQHRHVFAKPDPTCSECHGTGTLQSTYNPKSKWDWWGVGGRWRNELDGGNVLGVDALLALPEPYIPYAVVTPDGEWHEKGQMGWWGMSSNDKKQDKWQSEVIALYKQYPDHLAVLCDLHI